LTLDPRPDSFDRIEKGGGDRQIKDFRSLGFNVLSEFFVHVRGQVVEHDHFAFQIEHLIEAHEKNLHVRRG
jgi:hypothetical protein